MLPCQDTPGVKSTYSARLTVSGDLTALMSAISTGASELEDGKKVFEFEQKVAVPSYLIALVVGNLKGVEVGPRSTVWSEPEMVEAAAYEFSQTEEFIVAAESIVGPYVWGKYDILCLPPSFPYGGMENPSLTFVTPSLLAGDRSLAGVVAHEIAHSWTGNLVGCRTWEHFWLNEGHTVFLERKIGAIMSGGGAATGWAECGQLQFDFKALGGWNALTDSVRLYEEDGNLGFTQLTPDLSGDIDPDDAFSSVPYEKGFNTLYRLEKLVGGPPVFEPFLRSYVETFAHKSITTEDWRQYVISYFKDNEAIATLDWEQFMGAGMPPWDPEFKTDLADAAFSLSSKWAGAIEDLSGFAPEDVQGWNSGQFCLFLDRLFEEDPFSVDALDKMAELYGFGSTRNSEILFRFFKLNLRANNQAILSAATGFVTSIGRMKFVRPLYRELSKMSHELAVSTFKENELFYNPICHKMVSQDLGLA